MEVEVFSKGSSLTVCLGFDSAGIWMSDGAGVWCLGCQCTVLVAIMVVRFATLVCFLEGRSLEYIWCFYLISL